MQSIDKKQRYEIGERILLVGFFLAAYFLCSQISYTDGDDAYFSGMAHSMGFFEYLKMRYVGWEGRITSEAMTYIAFNLGKDMWQFFNGVMLTLLPVGLIHMVKKITGDISRKKSFFLSMVIYGTILSLGIPVIGYGAFWVTGSTFYLWSIVAGLWAAMPFVDLVYRKTEISKKSFCYAIPCGFIAAMGQEQIAAVVIAFGAIAVFYYYIKEKKLPWLHMLELAIMVVALVILFISPGTEARSQAEIDTWMPQYGTMSLGNHIFITVQWMLSSFANEGKMLFVILLGLGALLQWQKIELKCRIMAAVALVMAVIALLPYAGVTFFAEMGMGITDITQCVWQVAEPTAIGVQSWVAILWWCLVLVFTLVLLWQLGEGMRQKVTMVLLVLATMASEGIMFFSPTMYASGARVYFVAQILLWLLIGILAEKSLRKKEIPVTIFVFAAGIINVVSGIPKIISYL